MQAKAVRLLGLFVFAVGVLGMLLPQPAGAYNPNLELPWTSGG